MEATATAKFVRMSPRKVRFVLDTVRGKYAPEALAQLQFTPNFAAGEIAKVIKSACANAQNNFDMDPDALKIVRCYVDGGPVLKRVQPRAQGRAYRILKRTSHITVVVEDVERPVPPAKGVAKPVGRRQPLLAPSVLAATGGATAAAAAVPVVDETPQPVETVEETGMNAGAPATEEVAATPTEAAANASADAPVATTETDVAAATPDAAPATSDESGQQTASA
jgi:large subunit ribosomal protein L22